MQTTIRHAYALGRDGGAVDIEIQDGRIASLRASSPTAGETRSARLALTGFINAHTHLPMVLFRGLADDVPLQTWLEKYVWPLEKLLQPEDVYWCTLLAIAEGIRSGTTAFIDMYFHNDQIARAVEESGVRAVLSYGMIAPSLADGGTAELAVTRRLIRQWHGQADGRIRVAVSPHAVYTCGEDVWRAGIDLAQEYGLPIHTHVSETRSEVEDWKRRTGLSPVQYLDSMGALAVPMIAAHCVHVDEDDIKILANRPVTVAHCPKSNAKLGSGIAPIPDLVEAGVRVALGSDGAASNNRMDMLEELRAAWILQRAHHEDASLLRSANIAQMATDVARPLFDLEDDGFAVGAPGDVVVIETQHVHTTPPHPPAAMLAYASQSADVTDVFVHGKPLLESGELRTIDEERVKSEVQRLLHRIKNR